MHRLDRFRWLLLLPLLAVSPANSQEPSIAPPGPATAQAPTVENVQPVSPPSAEDIGDAYVARQRYQAAIGVYAKAPVKTAALWNKMGIAYQLIFNTKDALRCYKESLKLNPRNPLVLNNMGTVYASLKQYGQADKMYRKAIKLDPKSALYYKNMGTNLLAQRKYDRGWDAYQKALAIDPHVFSDRSSPMVENPGSLRERGAMNYYMAMGCARGGHAECAIDYLRRALNEGFTTRRKVTKDKDFEGLRDNPEFQQLLAEPEQ
jgi:tetratricopeptide (TPR) repeat protein